MDSKGGKVVGFNNAQLKFGPYPRLHTRFTQAANFFKTTGLIFVCFDCKISPLIKPTQTKSLHNKKVAQCLRYRMGNAEGATRSRQYEVSK